ncbi:MAG: T9SS type A sorting domain-containing protein [Bacteroidales bacterium]|nr:T9SS type A sorting domain-containing protein [Bacteroidales bacterium]
MKKSIFTLIAISLFFTGQIFAQYITAEDDAGNYSQSDFVSEGNLGFGFGNWFVANADGGYFRSAAAEQGAHSAVIDVANNSFGLWATGFSDVGRLLTTQMPDGGSLVFTLAYQWDDGNRGFSLANGDWGTEVFNFNINNAGYTWSGGGSAATTPWTGQREFGVAFLFVFTQNGNDLDYGFFSLAGGGPTGGGTITGVNFDRIKFYVSGAGGGTGANMYFNSLKTEFMDPAKVPETADVKINGNVTLNADQALTVNDLTIPTGNTFTLESTASGTGSLIINGTCTDEISVQRFITGNEAWHFLSSPVAGQAIVGSENFIEFVENVGDINVDFYSFDETNTDNTPWINIKSAGGALNPAFETTFEEGKGYLVAYAYDNLTKTFTGVPNTGTYNLSLSYTGAGQQGWNLIGNPYTSAIDWDKMTKSGLVSDYYYIYNPEMNGGGSGYEYYSSGASTSGANGEIPSMQAFMVWAADGGGQVDFTNDDRVHSTQDFLKRETVTDNRLIMKITGLSYFSESQVFISEGASPGQDQMDAAMLYSFNNLVPHFYSIDGNEKIAANAVPFPDEDYSIPMGLKTGEASTYTITAEDIENFNSSILPVLEDSETGMEIDLRFSESYTFEVVNPGILNDRFILHMKTAVGIEDLNKKPELIVSQIGNELHFYNLEPGNYDVRILDIMGRVLIDKTINNLQAINLPASLDSGTYVVQISNATERWVEKVVIH